MYKVDREFNDYKVGDLATFKKHIAKDLMNSGYISIFEPLEVSEKQTKDESRNKKSKRN